MKKSLLSRSVKILKEGMRKSAAAALQCCLRSKSYSVVGLPSGITYKSFPKQLMLPSGEGVLRVAKGTATRSGAILDQKGRLITDYLFVVDGKVPQNHDLFKVRLSNFSPNICQSAEPVIALSTGWQDAFYHWMYEVLPRLHLIESANLPPYPLFVSNRLSFQQETLALLGLERRVIDTHHYDAVIAPEIYASSVPHTATPWVTHYLRKVFLPLLSVLKQKRRIYVSRRDASKRRIINEEEILRILERYGFERVELGALPLLEQMALFRGAEAIVAPHGAGLSHIAFCDPKTVLLECFAPRLINQCYREVSKHLELHYTSLLGEREQGCAIDPDFEVNPAHLEAACELMFRKSSHL